MVPDAHSAFTTKLWQSDQPFPILLDRYQILGIIGEGGMGTVFKGFHLHLKRFVAVKTLRVGQDRCPELVSRFLKEMELVGQMDHAHVVRASDAWRRNEVLCLVMEYLAGQDLHHYVQRQGALEVAQACELTRQVAVGLDYVHKTMVHRDIKPSNLMLTSDGVVKILDLGLARFSFDQIDELEQTPQGMAVGTFSYMAPEQATRGTIVDGRADIYSLGCTLFKLLTGHAPFGTPEYDNAIKVVAAHSLVPIEKAPRFGMIPETLREVVSKMLAKDPENRYATGEEVAAVLTPFISEHTPAQLSWQTGGDETSTLRPLTWPLPDVLSRLTEMPFETAASAPSVANELVAPVPLKPVSASMHWLLMACILFAAMSMPIAYVGMVMMQPRKNEAPSPPPVAQRDGVRDMDKLQSSIGHPLFDRQPSPLGLASAANPPRWRWDQNLGRLEVRGPETLFFPLGTTNSFHFQIDVGLNQSPWTGEIGLYWGYRQNDEVLDRNIRNIPFATCQYLILNQRNDNKLGNLRVCRGSGQVVLNPQGLFDLQTDNVGKVDLAPLVGPNEQILTIEIQNGQLIRAVFASVELKRLFNEEATKVLAGQTCQGTFGVFALGHDARFSSARFINLANQ